MDVGPTESQLVLADAAATATVTDAKGRVIEVKRPSRRETMRYMRMWGTACNVESWLALALVTVSAKSIDGVPVPVAVTPDKVEMAAELLGDEGLNALSQWYQDQPQADLGAERAAAKN